MLPGFLPFARHSTFMLDVVVVAMVVVVPVLTWSVLQAKRGRYNIHKWTQIVLGTVLLIAVILFEVEMRLAGGWRELAKHSPYFGGWLDWELYVHLFFAVGTTILWIVTSVDALRKIPTPPVPGPHARLHRILGPWSAVFMLCTAVTGWTFYWMAFVAT